MKLPTGLLLLCLALTVSLRAEEAVPVKEGNSAAKRELVWPEIKDPQALIDFAKAEITKLKARGKESGKVDESTLKEIAYLHPTNCEIFASNGPYAQMVVGIETHPFNGQAIIIVPFIKDLSAKQKEANSFAKIIDTVTPEIKWALMPLALKSCFVSEMKSFETVTLTMNWRNVQNLDEDKNTWPIPLNMGFPAYPGNMIKNRSSGEAKVGFTVTEQGLVAALNVTSQEESFASAVRDVAQLWKFEPGVENRTHLPAATRISLTVKFNLDDGIEHSAFFEVIKSRE